MTLLLCTFRHQTPIHLRSPMSWRALFSSAAAPCAAFVKMQGSSQRIVQCVGSGDEAPQQTPKKWPSWGPNPDADLTPFLSGGMVGKDCIVCSQAKANCRCKATDDNDWAQRSVNTNSKSHSCLKHLLYDDPLYKAKVPWLRTFLKEAQDGQRN